MYIYICNILLIKKVAGVDGEYVYGIDCGDNFIDTHISNLIKLHTLKMQSFLHVNHNSIKCFLKSIYHYYVILFF